MWLPLLQKRPHSGKENDSDNGSIPEHGAAAAAVADKRKPGQPAAKKKQRASAPLPGAAAAAAAAPDTEAKPLSERLAAHRKRSLAEPDAEEQEGAPATKKLKGDKAKSSHTGRETCGAGMVQHTCAMQHMGQSCMYQAPLLACGGCTVRTLSDRVELLGSKEQQMCHVHVSHN